MYTSLLKLLQNYNQERQGVVLVIRGVQEKRNAEIYADNKMKQDSIVFSCVFTCLLFMISDCSTENGQG